jgi:hypothetical protein
MSFTAQSVASNMFRCCKKSHCSKILLVTEIPFEAWFAGQCLTYAVIKKPMSPQETRHLVTVLLSNCSSFWSTSVRVFCSEASQKRFKVYPEFNHLFLTCVHKYCTYKINKIKYLLSCQSSRIHRNEIKLSELRFSAYEYKHKCRTCLHAVLSKNK